MFDAQNIEENAAEIVNCEDKLAPSIWKVPELLRRRALQQYRYCTCKRNNEARSCNHCCSGKAINITFCERVSVALVIQHAMRMRNVVICGLPRSTICFHNIKYKARY
jgi:hypothetical protein